MIGRLNQCAEDDFKRVAASDDWGVDITVIDIQGRENIVKGLTTKHTQRLDPDEGTIINSPLISVMIHEESLTALGYVTRSGGETVLSGWIIKFTDAINVQRTYNVRESYPDEKIGFIRCELDIVNA